MQSYQPQPGKNLPELPPDFFMAESNKKLSRMMTKAAKQKSKKGYNVLKRTKIDPNGFCPCNSGEKFLLCCANKAIKS